MAVGNELGMLFVTTLASLVGALVLVLIAAIHVYWGFGGVWPARDQASLVRRVIGATPDMRMPGLLACMTVATGLMLASWSLLVSSELLDGPRGVAQAGTLATAVVLGARGIGGFFHGVMYPDRADTPFAHLNRWWYSPLCLLLSGLALSVWLYA